MRSFIRSTFCGAVVLIGFTACSDATAPVASSARSAAQPAEFARGGGRSIPTGIPATVNLPGGAHFELAFSQLQGYLYIPINAAAAKIAPHGLTLDLVPIP
ncbi:MAG TPA: hypothetical protein VN706_01185 [Gemmatimonadaceae bacterium]|nr:hypothetical protein [Gemmatimonadaceae bacterium]